MESAFSTLNIFFSILLLWGVSVAFASSKESSENIILKAAKRHAVLAKKSEDISLTNHFTLAYVEGIVPTHECTSYFVLNITLELALGVLGPRLTSTLQMQSDRPALFLEDFDHLLDEVECNDSTMVVTFRYIENYRSAYAERYSMINGWIVSSHLTCSEEGAHSVFR